MVKNKKTNLPADFLSKAIAEAVVEGILLIDVSGSILYSNNNFVKLWNIPNKLISQGDDKKLLDFVLDQIKEPEKFIKKVEDLYKSKDTTSDFIYFKDGRVFERFSAPLIKDKELLGRVWSFRDATDGENYKKEKASDANKKEKINSQLQTQISEMTKLNKLTVGRELKMIELKKEIIKLKNELASQKPLIAARKEKA